VQVGDGMPAARRKGSRAMPPPPLRGRQPGVQYFHSRSCIPMTREESEASVDSDDEPDTEAWQVRSGWAGCAQLRQRDSCPACKP
jgi:VEFS-Box of polycomb protein